MTHDFLILGLNAERESCCFSSAHFNSIVFCLAAPHKQKVGTLSVPDMRQICRSVSPSKQATRRDFILAYGVSQHSISITLGLDISHL